MPSPTTARRKNRPSAISQPSGRKQIAFGWYGGKYSHLDWLLPLLPTCHHYCEPFAGSAAVLINRPPSPVETYNDLDGEVVNFFRTLRDEKERLTECIGLTPFSREEFAIACQFDSDLPAVERARRFYVRARQVRIGLAQTASLGRWGNCVGTSRAGMSGIVSRWLGGVEALPEIANRLLRVQIENRPALEILTVYDSPETLFYCDPPYLHETRGDSKAYGQEMNDEQHHALAAALQKIQGKAAVSGYDHPLMDQLFPAPTWHKIAGPIKTNHATKGQRQEFLWTNYQPEDSRSYHSPEEEISLRLHEDPPVHDA